MSRATIGDILDALAPVNETLAKLGKADRYDVVRHSGRAHIVRRHKGSGYKSTVASGTVGDMRAYAHAMQELSETIRWGAEL